MPLGHRPIGSGALAQGPLTVLVTADAEIATGTGGKKYKYVEYLPYDLDRIAREERQRRTEREARRQARQRARQAVETRPEARVEQAVPPLNLRALAGQDETIARLKAEALAVAELEQDDEEAAIALLLLD